MKIKSLLFVFSILLPLFGNAQAFEPTFKSLQNYECPEWIQEAKFGIYCHWNAHSASKSSSNGWYARDMYIQGHSAYNDHLKNWGHPSEVGYKDVIKSWTADKFDAKEWVALFKKAGARYIITMAVHHDNFDMWDSKYQPRWNSMNYGPEVDVCGEIRKETLKAGLRWGVSTHLERTYSWFQTNKGSDARGEYAGVPYDGNLKEYQDLYLEYPDFDNLGSERWRLRSPLVSPKSWKDEWKNRLQDLIENYDPDFFYIDGALPYTDDGGKVGLELEAFYLNHNAKSNNGKTEGFFCFKDIPHHGVVYPGIATFTLERGYSEEIQSNPMLTEESLGPWFHTGQSDYYGISRIIHSLVDVVSKNCVFLLNVPPKADGSFDKAAINLLEQMGRWMDINGDAIYETKPWGTFGEGNIRFTKKDNVLNVFVDSDLKNNILIASTKGWKISDIVSIKLLGSDEVIEYNESVFGIIITKPTKLLPLKNVFQIECKNLEQQPYTVINLESVENINKEAAEIFGADGHGLTPLTK